MWIALPLPEFLLQIVECIKSDERLEYTITHSLRMSYASGSEEKAKTIELNYDDLNYAVKNWVFHAFLMNPNTDIEALAKLDPASVVGTLSELLQAYEEDLERRPGLVYVAENLLTEVAKHPQFALMVKHFMIERENAKE